MAIVSYMRGLTADQYELSSKHAKELGAIPRPGHILHLCFGDPDDLQIVGVWETREGWDRFFHDFARPALEEFGIDASSITVYEVHSFLQAMELAGS